MKTIAIIGSNGLLGSDLVRYFSKKRGVTAINKDTYGDLAGSSFDIVINANGNSKRFWANKNPVEDFVASTDSVIRSIFDFACDTYVYISSPDVYNNHTSPKHTKENAPIDPAKLEAYGLHKHLSEQIVKKYKKNFLILRSAMFLGSNLKKGPIYDALRGNNLFITLRSKLQLITTFEIAKIIDVLLNKAIKNEVINIGGMGTLSFTKLEQIINKKVLVSLDAKTQRYEMDVKKLKRLYPSLKSSSEYLQEFMADRVVQFS